MEKFGYPDTCVKDYEHWCVLLRSKQVTLGSLILLEKSEATRYGDLAGAAYLEQKQAIADIEKTLIGLFGAERINYLMLMMTDPNVHFHVIPRYPAAVNFAGQDFKDAGWPKRPEMDNINEISSKARQQLLETLRAHWPGNTRTA